MARIRTVKPEFFPSMSEKGSSLGARVLFAGMLTEADDAGRMIDSAKSLAGTIFPYDDNISPRKVEGWLKELEQADSIRRYEAKGRRFIAITNFNVHQKISHPTPSRLPAPPENPPNGSGEKSEPLRSDLGSGSGSGSGSVDTLSAVTNGGSARAKADNGFTKAKSEPLVLRLVHLCSGPKAQTLPESQAVIDRCQQVVDDRLIDECIGYCEGLPQRPTHPRYILSRVAEQAAKHGIVVAEDFATWEPKRASA